MTLVFLTFNEVSWLPVQAQNNFTPFGIHPCVLHINCENTNWFDSHSKTRRCELTFCKQLYTLCLIILCYIY